MSSNTYFATPLSALGGFFSIALGANLATAATVGPLDFESGIASGNQYTQNFLQLYARNGATLQQTDPADDGEPNNDYLRLPQNSNNITFVSAINTSAVKSLDNSDTFNGTVTVSFSASSNMPGGSSLGIYLFNPASVGGADNLLVNMQFNQSGGTDRIRFYSDGATTTGSTGTQYKGTAITGSTSGWLTGGDSAADTYWSNDFLPSTSESLESWTAGALVYAPGIHDDTTLTLTLGTTSVTWTIDNTMRIDNPAIALRFDGYGSGSGSWRIDDIHIVPEPASLALISVSALVLMRRRHGQNAA